MIHLYEIELIIDETRTARVACDGFFQTDEGLDVAIHGTSGSDETAIAITNSEHRHFFTVEAEANDGAEKGIHAWGVTAAE
jgi:hypothetical protein